MVAVLQGSLCDGCGFVSCMYGATLYQLICGLR